MSYLQECLKKFESLPPDFKNRFGSLEVFEKIETIEAEYGIDLKFLVILVAIGEVSLSGIPEYLQTKYKLAEEDAYEIRNRLVSNIFQLNIGSSAPDFSEFGSAGSSNVLNVLLESETEVTKIFHENLAAVLKNQVANNTWNLGDLNEAIFFWLSKDGTLQDELSKSLLNSQERLTSERLLIEDREVLPTIANWLHDFIKISGSEMFDELALAQYLSTAPNARKLSPAEKELIRKLLKFYRNLVFFPDSMENSAIDDWQIIPVDVAVKVTPPKVLVKTVVAARTEVPAKTASAAKTETQTKTEISPLIELKQALARYTPGSLEYKAVAQEIERLKKKK